MIIEKIQKNKLYLSNEEIIDISPSIKQRYGLKVGDDIESLYDDISYEASLEKGIFLLSLKDRTKKEIQMKLNEKYRNAKMVEKAVLKLIELGYIDDLNYAISYINSRKYGKQRITYNLLQKGLNKEKIEEAYSTIQDETEKDIEEEKLKKVILKNIKKDEKKLVQYLVRQGFELDNIFRKLREYKEFDGFEDFMEQEGHYENNILSFYNIRDFYLRDFYSLLVSFTE